MNNEEKILDTQTKPDEKLDEYPADEKTDDDLINMGIDFDIDTGQLASELISAQGSELEEIVEIALANYEQNSLLELSQDLDLDVRENLRDFTQKSEVTGNWEQVLCIYCRQVIADGLEESLEVYTKGLPQNFKTSIWSCNSCASSKTYRDFEVHFLKIQLPYTFKNKEEQK